MENNNFTTISISKDWYLANYNTHTPFRNNSRIGSEMNRNITQSSKRNLSNAKILKNKSSYGYELKDNKSINKKNVKRCDTNKTLKNRNIFGNESNNKLSNTSITKPRYWPSRGLFEK